MGTSACENILEDSAKTNTDEALFFEAKKLLNDADYTGAIVQFERMSASYLASREVVPHYASAYAGRCGLSYLGFVESLGSIGTTKLFRFLMNTYPGSVASQVTDCMTAESIMLTAVSDPALRTVDENLLVTFTSFTKIGTILNTYADTDNDGSPDGGFDACNAGSLAEADARQVATGLAIALAALQEAASETTIGSGETSTLTSGCADLAVLAPTFDFCTVTDPATLSADQIKGIRSVIQENEWVGIGSCNDTLDNCLCP